MNNLGNWEIIASLLYGPYLSRKLQHRFANACSEYHVHKTDESGVYIRSVDHVDGKREVHYEKLYFKDRNTKCTILSNVFYEKKISCEAKMIQQDDISIWEEQLRGND